MQLPEILSEIYCSLTLEVFLVSVKNLSPEPNRIFSHKTGTLFNCCDYFVPIQAGFAYSGTARIVFLFHRTLTISNLERQVLALKCRQALNLGHLVTG